MAKLIYSMLMSLDGFVEGPDGGITWGMPDPEVHDHITELSATVGTHLYGRRMYDTMVYWETAPVQPGLPDFALGFARTWQAAEKVVYSRTMTQPRSARTRIEPEFDIAAVRRLKETAAMDITISGPELAGHALRAGLVDTYQLILCPVILGGGKRFFPDRATQSLQLTGSRSFDSGVVVLHYSDVSGTK